ncbi:hypothetical protein [Tritonibacter mobilis]|jgi:hypothetical protein|uniref:hypothetical protein n=1 Tax=Tritonibacter mobilis TaxID=379347 RepID=UPI000806ACC2|nr:hypothetical protein [Tritonibacter mobilis]GLP87863.1 hypothetical protein GCM10007921_34240 [Tritonibacter mobilis]SDX47175.1 hypothetical protein SAMN05444385_10829 [Tritonibacter mobilis]
MKKRVVMLVSNPCNPDYRVTKEAESLARAGYEVCILATWKPKLGIPIQEEINGVTYLRFEWNVLKILRMMYLGEKKYREIPTLNRDKHRAMVETLPIQNRDKDQ